MNNKNRTLLLSTILSIGLPVAAFAQLEVGGDMADYCSEITALQSAGDISAARDSARLCLEGLEQQVSGQVSDIFPKDVGQWTRTNLEQNQIMGFNNITANYKKNGNSVNVALTGQSGGGGGAGGLASAFGGLLGGIAQSAMLQEGKRVTVAGLPATIQPDGTLTVPLEDGSFLSFDSPSFNNADEALSGMGDLINDFPVADINAALQ